MSATPKTSRPQSTKPRKARAPRRPRRTAASSDEEADIRRAHSSDSDDTSTVSDSDTLSSSEDSPNTPAPPATATDHSVSPPSTRRSKKAHKPKPDDSLIPAQPTSWSDLVNQEEIHSSGPPIIDFADFVSGGVAGLDSTPGPSRTEPKEEGGEPGPAARGRSKPRGGKTQRQAYLEKLNEDPSFIPRVGNFWGHDERLLAPELRGMSDWWRGRWGGRGRGGRGRGTGRFANGPRPERPAEQEAPENAPSPPPIERTWGHDGFEKMKDQERERAQGQARGGARGRGRGRGRGGRGPFIPRYPEPVTTKAADTQLHFDPSTRPQFPGQARGIKVNVPGQWRPSIVRGARSSKSSPARPLPKTAVDMPAEIVVKLPGKQAKIVSVPAAGPSAPAKPAEPEEPETVQPLQDVPPKVVTRLPGSNAGAGPTSAPAVPATSAPKFPTEFIPRPAPTSALPAQVLQQADHTASAPKPAPQLHGRTRSQQDAVAFARPSAVPTTEPSVPLSFGSFELPPLATGSAPPSENNAAPSPGWIGGPSSAPLPSTDSPPPVNNAGPAPVSIRPPPPHMASFTPPPAGYYNPYATYNPLDGATYYTTATPPPPPPHGMYYPANGFFVPPRPRGPVSIRAPGEPPSAGVNGGEERAPVPPMWNYYPPPPHSHSHSHSHGHNQYYSPSGTPYPPPPPGPPQPGYYPGAPGEYPGVYDYGNGGVYY